MKSFASRFLVFKWKREGERETGRGGEGRDLGLREKYRKRGKEREGGVKLLIFKLRSKP